MSLEKLSHHRVEVIVEEDGSNFEAIKLELAEELEKLDLTQNEAKILLHLIANGPSVASDISRNIDMPRTETYHYISSLLGKGIVLSTFSKPRKYYSLSFDEVVDHLVQTKYNTLRSILQNKKDYQRKLDRIAVVVTTASSASSSSSSQEPEEDKSYQIIAGEDAINARMQRMLDCTDHEICAKLSEKVVGLFYHAETIDHFISSAKRGARVSIKTHSRSITHYLNTTEVKLDLSILPETQDPISPSDFVVFDDKEVMILIDDANKKQKMCAFYANNPGIVSTFKCIFGKI